MTKESKEPPVCPLFKRLPGKFPPMISDCVSGQKYRVTVTTRRVFRILSRQQWQSSEGWIWEKWMFYEATWML